MNLLLLKFILVFLLVTNTMQVYANETCSRVAQINFQNILVDTNSSKKGEGLRFHLEKDSIALSYLDKYQEDNKIKWQNAALGTIGTGLLLGGAMSSGSKSIKKNLLITGGTLILVNYLMAKTLEVSNEENLTKAINEYNKRNLPRIYFSPGPNNSTNKQNFGTQVYIEKDWNF